MRGAAAALLAVLLAALTALLLVEAEPGPARAGYGVRGSRYQPALVSRYGAVASASPDASAAGVSVLAAGGNAVDAAVATVFAVGVAAQESCGVGGGGFLLYRSAGGTAAALDFRETAPAGLPPDFEAAPRHFRGTGHQVVGVPGTVAGMAEVAQRFGSKPFRELLRPAIDLAERGVRLTPFQIEVLTAERERLDAYDEARRLYLDNGAVPAPYPIGHERPQADLARTLQTLAGEGPQAFYRGPIPRRSWPTCSARNAPRSPRGSGA
jgi:gamma-glutamyltranspeptidase/glutathione hydrolase